MDKKPWHWCGPVRKEGPNVEDVYAIVSIEEGVISLSISDSTYSFTGNVALQSQSKAINQADSDELAHVRSENLPLLIEQAFGAAGTRPTKVRVQRSLTDGLQLRISALWGEEFGEHALDLDIMSINLQRQSHNEHFLQTMFTHIADARNQCKQVEKKCERLQIQFQDASEALQHIEKTTTMLRSQSMGVFLNALNRHKRKAAAISLSK